MSDKPKVIVHDEARNVTAIHNYWKRRAEGDWSVKPDLRYLLDTGRITPDEAGDVYKPFSSSAITAHKYHSMAEKARIEDGDQTLWSDPPKTWLEKK